MHLLRNIAVAAVAIYSLNVPVLSRSLPSASLNNDDIACGSDATCLKHAIEAPAYAIRSKRSSLISRAPVVPVRPIRPKPDEPDSPIVPPGDTPSRPGDPSSAPPRPDFDSDTSSEGKVLGGASHEGDEGFELEGEYKSPEAMLEKGRRVDGTPFATTTGGEAQNALADLRAKFDKAYREERDYKEDGEEKAEPLDADEYQDLEPSFEDLEINMETNDYRDVQTFSATGNEPFGYSAVWTKQSDKDGVIIAESLFSDRDLTPKDGGKRLKISDLTLLQWVGSNTQESVKNLKAVIFRHVLNRSSVETMQTAQKKTDVALYQQATFKRGETDPRKAEAFEMMMGTDLVSSMAYMLKDNAPVCF
ncbi:MAG: hypothetical protein LQ337_001087 [Flavoplaca oasis]|nr:MAG: hypothetical protein LQ337_001087 [Flavoplaca oasis]